jgi:hypothetical protein
VTAPLRLSGSLRGGGRREAAPDGWLGDREGGAALESLRIDWPGRARGVDLAYGCFVEGEGERPAVLTGTEAGAPGGGRALTGVWFDLVGPTAGLHALEAEAVFARAGERRFETGTPLISAMERDFLTALRVAVRTV